MTVGGTRRALTSRWRLLVVVLVAVAGTGVLAMSGLQGTTVYYLTPTEILGSDPGEHVRLGGLVEVGTVRGTGDQVEFVLTDGTQDVLVAATVALPRVFTEGEGAVVEGTLGADGVFHADQVMVRHSNEYRAPEAGS
ncbi:cytochrome c maturation protein CcmE [Pseudonocardia sp. MH-G8]|uniref:cytochrome c maturation protein CcmE n=1 Tax=Pseudonocardia sp. MH-G8 TaxID=1854588 RepID=UPI00130420C2|nr:cytochrome c maturation protein CcmE [Pseudonocardia sp. MH-G8]